MTRPRWLSPLSLGTAAMMIVVACSGGAATPAPATTVPTVAATAAPTTAATAAATPAATVAGTQVPATEAPTVAPSVAVTPAPPQGTPYPDPAAQPPAPAEGLTAYPDPAYGQVKCATDTEGGSFNGLPYSGNLKSITAPDPMTVVFTFCNPDVAFLSQIAFSALAIDDAGYLITHMPASVTAPDTAIPEGSLLTTPNGTGPYKLSAWDRGNRMDFARNDDYWGTKAKTPNVEFLWSDQSAARLVALQAGTVDGIDNPGKDDLPAIQGKADLTFFPRTGLNTMYIGMNNKYDQWKDVKVRQAIAMGIDRKQIVDKFYPPGSEVADFFTPCAIPNSCGGDTYYKFDPVAAKQLLTDAGFPNGFETKLSFRAAVRGYLPDPPTIAQEIANQLKANLNITATLDLQESGTYLDNNAAGKLPGLFILGWGADFPDTSNFLDYHFGAGTGDKFGKPFPDLQNAVVKGGQTAKDADRLKFYTQANNLIKKYVPGVFVAHGGSGTAFKKDVVGAYAAPLIEKFKDMDPAGRDTLVWMQNAEPISLYCADETDGETLRACEQIKESLYTYGGESGLDPKPALAKECKPNAELTVWTCTLRDGVKFHDGAAFAADDVILSFAAQWDVLNKLHVGRTGSFEYWAALIGQGYLNPPAPCGLPNSSPCT